MTAAMTAAVAALRSLGLVDIVPVTALYGGGWTEAQLWTARTPSNLAAPGDAWTGPDTIWPVSAPIAAWRAAEAGTWCNTTRAPVGHISISARRADHANHLNVALDAGVARGLPDPR